jgi:hypothetical protein
MAGFDLLAQLKHEIAVANGSLIEAIEDLGEEQIQARPGGTLPSIAFHIWHSARWADYDREIYGGGTQVWHSQGFAERWNLAGISQSEAETGTGLSDEQAGALVFPSSQELVSYASAAFAAFEGMIAPLDEAQLALHIDVPAVQGGNLQALLFGQLVHVNRHLGMIEAIKGVQGLRGTATR